MKIITQFLYPPIPTRIFDWCAYIDGHEECNIGYGETKEAAIEALMDLENQEDDGEDHDEDRW
jgi:hypothetical protein